MPKGNSYYLKGGYASYFTCPHCSRVFTSNDPHMLASRRALLHIAQTHKITPADISPEESTLAIDNANKTSTNAAVRTLKSLYGHDAARHIKQALSRA